MTLIQKIQQAFRSETPLQADDGKKKGKGSEKRLSWREKLQQRRMRARRRLLTVENLMKSIDPAEMAKVQELSARENLEDVFWTKYLDADKWLTLNIRYAKELGLLEKPARSVLDIGCGGGFFLVVCRMLGARVLGVDLDKDLVLNEMIRVFKLQRVTWRVRAFVKLPDFKRKFDLITAFMICFNFPPKHPYWGARQWHFFINDMADRLLPKGRLLLSLNKQPDGKEYDDVLKAYFESRGGVVTGKRIVFTKEGLEATREVISLTEGVLQQPRKAQVAVATVAG